MVVGALVLVFRKKFVIASLEFQRKAFGIKYGNKEEISTTILAVAVGVVLIIFSLVNLLK